MTDYTKSTNFASKDSLLSGNPLKLVKGTELDTEFNNIATSITTKADTTQVATDINDAITAAVTTILGAAYPVGSIYVNASNSTNPGTLLGFGTWVAFGEGRVAVGYKSGDALFGTAGNTGGSQDAVVVSHNHTTDSQGDGTFWAANRSGHTPTGVVSYTGSTDNSLLSGGGLSGDIRQFAISSHSHTTTTVGSSGTNANLQPYVTVYMWKRTA